MPSFVVFLTIMVYAQAMLAVTFNAVGVLGPVAAPALGYTTAVIGPYVAAISAASLAGGLFMDGVLRRYGGARTLQISAFLGAIGMFMAATANVPLVALSCVLVGWSGGMLVPASIHLLSRHTPPERMGMVFAINQCGIPAGFGLAGVAFPALLFIMDWQGTVLVVAILMVSVIVALQPMRAALDTDRDPAAPLGGKSLLAPIRMAWGDPTLRVLGWLAFSFMTVQQSMLAYIVSYVKLELGHSHIAAGSILLIATLSAVVMRLIMGWMLDRMGRHLTVLGIIGFSAGLVSVLLGVASPGWPYAVIVLLGILSGVTMMGWNAVYFAAVAKFAPEGRSGTAVGGTQVFTAVGATVGPMIFASILGATGRYSTAFIALSVFSLAMGLRLLLMRPPARSASAAPEAGGTGEQDRQERRDQPDRQ